MNTIQKRLQKEIDLLKLVDKGHNDKHLYAKTNGGIRICARCIYVHAFNSALCQVIQRLDKGHALSDILE